MAPKYSFGRLVQWFRDEGKGGVVVAFSGGVDSTLVATAASKALGDCALAITVRTEFMTPGEIAGAVSTAKGLGLRHRVLRLRLPEEVKRNPPERCYLCKRLILRRLKDHARTAGYARVVDGTNLDDSRSSRPGLRALREEGIRSPLAELGMGKAEVREVSRHLGLDYDKPSSPCLATRFPTSHRIRRAELEAVAKAEEYLRNLGFREVRVRFRGGLAKIEVERGRLGELLEKDRQGEVEAALKAMGFKEVALDLAGYVPEGGRREGIER